MNQQKTKLNQSQMKKINEYTQKTQKTMLSAMDALKQDNFKKARILLNVASAEISNFSDEVEKIEKEVQ
jgi:hypothetical protein